MNEQYAFHDLESKLRKFRDLVIDTASSFGNLGVVHRKKIEEFMPLIYEAYKLAGALSKDEIRALRDMGAAIDESVLYGSIAGADSAIRDYLKNRDIHYSCAQDALRIIELVEQMQSFSPEKYFQELLYKANHFQ